ncbi:helix-turn-helix domain-containing protein [Calothrix sp. CCY 0018]|uniref:helix-turn-helix domain-containing protein n=1 Tax=Calothrix sp. CCY 0018 TaxID=3103864 RepID=UPI0039C61D2D
MKTVSSTKPVTITHSSEEGLINSSQDLGWEYIVFNEYQLAPTQISYPAFPQHNLYLCLANRPYRIHHLMGKQRYVGIYSRGDIGITPAGIASIYRTEGNDHFLQIQIEQQFLHQVAQETDEIDASSVELIPKFRERNPQIEQIIMMLYSELHQGSGWGSKLYIESLSNALAVNLLRGYSVKKTNFNLHSVGLSDSKLLLVTDYINDNIGTEIKISDLAALVGISQFHFSRLFKKSVGMSPHKYVIKQRLERAKSLLKNPELSVTDIALLCGFNSHSHLGKYFRQLTGFTPKQYRN